MKHKTIWESASRPLSVRSVWLETPHANGALQRHFILDYEPQQKQKQLKTAASPLSSKRESLNHSWSYDLITLQQQQNAVTNYDLTAGSEEDIFFLGSGKVKLHQPITPQQYRLEQKLEKNGKRRSRKNCSHDWQEQRRGTGDRHNELYSRRSSLQDLQSMLSNVCSNPDERLAERVLNWLDLAGKSDILKIEESSNNMESNGEKKSIKSPLAVASATKARHAHITVSVPSQRLLASSRKYTAHTKSSHHNHSIATNHTHATCHYRPDSVRPITIIFNKEGIPVRFNRPARNIDLCALASSAGTTRRLAGALASARLYNNSSEYAIPSATGCCVGDVTTATSLCHTRKGNENVTHKPAVSKYLQQDSAVHNINDAKRQLHIFMPSLPKKPQITSEISDTTCICADDSSVTANAITAAAATASVLSSNFSELCNLKN